MRFSPLVLLLFVLLGFDFAAPIPSANAAGLVETQEQAIAAIKKLGGKVTIDKKSPNKPVIEVDLSRTKVTDKGLIQLSELFQLQSLNLSSTKITDDGLGYLTGLTRLQTLNLFNTKVTSAGLEHLKGLTKLQILFLGSTEITDAGLKYLKGLT